MKNLAQSTLRNCLAASCICASAICASAQSDPVLGQYYQVPSLYNPAAIGLTDNLRIRAAGRLQWVGIDNAPRTFAGVADMPVKIGSRRVGVGLAAMQESQGLYSTLALSAQGAWKFRKFGGEWSVGIGIGMYDQSFKGTEVYIPDNDDYHQSSDTAIPTTDIHGTALDLDAGLFYNHRLFWAGASLTHLTSPTVSMSTDNGTGSESGARYTYQAKSTFYFMGGCNIPLKNTLFDIVPSFMVASDFNFTAARLTAAVRYRRFITFGIGYSLNDAVTATVSAEIRNFFIGYSYDYATSAINRASSGSHELILGYSLRLDLGEKNRNRHKSVRIM